MLRVCEARSNVHVIGDRRIHQGRPSQLLESIGQRHSNSAKLQSAIAMVGVNILLTLHKSTPYLTSNKEVEHLGDSGSVR